MKKILQKLSVIAACLILGACAIFTPVNPIYDVEWELELETLEGANRNWVEPISDISMIIKKDGSISGNAGVNRFFGTANTVKIDPAEGMIKFDQVGVTMMAGPGMEYESAFLKVLPTVTGYRIIDGDLILYRNSTIVAVFED